MKPTILISLLIVLIVLSGCIGDRQGALKCEGFNVVDSKEFALLDCLDKEDKTTCYNCCLNLREKGSMDTCSSWSKGYCYEECK